MALTSNPPRPRLACEISAERVIAGRANAAHTAVEVYSHRRLPAGALHPNLASANVLNRDAVRHAVRDALDTVAGGLRDAIVIIPDAAVRILLLDFDDLPQKQDDALAVIRFRARKSLPFDADSAILSFQADRTRRPVKVVAAFSPSSIIAEYEELVSDAGLAPGVVLPSVIAALGLVTADRPTMIVKVDGPTTTVSIVEGSNLILLRTLEVAHGDITANVLPSMVFYEDTYAAKLERVLLAGDAETATLAAALQQELNVRVAPLADAGLAGDTSFGDALPPSVLAPVAGGLVG